MIRTTLAALLALAGASAAPAQELDRGVFIITHDGAPAGREEFALRQQTNRRLAVSTTRAAGREVQQALELTNENVPISYTQTVSIAGRVGSRISASLNGARFSARVSSAEGENAREFPVRAPAVILSDDAFSAYYFVPRPTGTPTRTVHVVRPGEPRAAEAVVTAAGDDTVAVGDRRIAANRFTIRIGEADTREFWMSSGGDLLKVAIPARNLVATRAELPQR